MRICWILGVALVAVPVAAALSAAVPAVAAERRPNIVVILSDDMGYTDIGCYGSEINTPNLDALADGGLRFTQFYNTARCCPTRATLLTGLYAHQAGIGHMMGDKGQDGYRGNLNEHCVTIAQVLGPAGYRNYAVGKWHVTLDRGPEGPKHNWPLERGFDRYYGTIHGGGSYFDPSTLTRDNTQISPYADPEYTPKTFYYTDAISHHAAQFVDDHAEQHAEAPFFMYVAYTAAHWPMHALPEDIARYRHKYDAGYEPIRRTRFEKAARLGVIDRRHGLSPQAGDWNQVEDKAWEAAGMEVYAAMVDRMDQGIGKIVEALRRNGQLDNTLVLYMQDNGGCAENTGRMPRDGHPNIARADKPPLAPLDAAALLPPNSVPPQTRDGHPVRMGNRVMPGPADTFLAYGRGWANVSNTPFREYKHWVHEGGISTPLVAHWPARIKTGGQLRQQPSHLIDIMATCLDISGATYPEQHGGHAIVPPEGKSLVPAFEDRPIEREALFWEHERNRAVRVGNWKLVAKGARGAWELYDLSVDRAELNNLAETYPERVKSMAKRWERWAVRAKVKPYPNEVLSRSTKSLHPVASK